MGLIDPFQSELGLEEIGYSPMGLPFWDARIEALSTLMETVETTARKRQS